MRAQPGYLLFTARLRNCCLAAAVITAVFVGTGCQTSQRWWSALQGDGFPEWSENMGASPRGNGEEAKPSGYFTDKRSEQIEKSLGGGF